MAELDTMIRAVLLNTGSEKPNKSRLFWWTHKGSNLGPLPCEGNALPLSYASGIFVRHQGPVNRRSIKRYNSSVAAIYEVRGTRVKLSYRNRAGEGSTVDHHAPGWRAREAWYCSARMRSAKVPPPS